MEGAAFAWGLGTGSACRAPGLALQKGKLAWPASEGRTAGASWEENWAWALEDTPVSLVSYGQGEAVAAEAASALRGQRVLGVSRPSRYGMRSISIRHLSLIESSCIGTLLDSENVSKGYT